MGVPFLLCSLSLTLSHRARLLFLVGVGSGVSCVGEEEKLNLKLFIWIKMDAVEEGGSCFTNSKHCARMV